MDNLLISLGFMAAFSIALMLWDIMAKKLAKRFKVTKHHQH